MSTDDSLLSLFHSAKTIWHQYNELGPGRVDAALFVDVERAIQQLDGDRRIEDSQLETLRDLCHRCCCRSEGLCFITGEAGLIPRRDLYEAFESSLEAMRRACEDD